LTAGLSIVAAAAAPAAPRNVRRPMGGVRDPVMALSFEYPIEQTIAVKRIVTALSG